MGIVKYLSLLRRFFTDAAFRSSVIGGWKRGDNYFQKETYTTENRYPLVFAACASYLSKETAPRILSYGCSTGEEAFTLGKQMPNAHILGVDINEWCVAQASKKYGNERISFLPCLDTAFIADAGFDAIFCMAVLQHTANRKAGTEKATGISFSRFEEEVNMLDSKLRTGGLLIIDHADFLFQDTECSARYRPLGFEHNMIVRQRPAYNRNNERTAEEQHIHRVFVKIG